MVTLVPMLSCIFICRKIYPRPIKGSFWSAFRADSVSGHFSFFGQDSCAQRTSKSASCDCRIQAQNSLPQHTSSHVVAQSETPAFVGEHCLDLLCTASIQSSSTCSRIKCCSIIECGCCFVGMKGTAGCRVLVCKPVASCVFCVHQCSAV